MSSYVTKVAFTDHPTSVVGQVQPTRVTLVSVAMPGPSGSAAATYTHNQVSPSNSWLIDHNLAYYPNVSAFDDVGGQLVGQVIHHSVNQLEIKFTSTRTGIARLS